MQVQGCRFLLTYLHRYLLFIIVPCDTQVVITITLMLINVPRYYTGCQVCTTVPRVLITRAACRGRQ